MSDIKANTCPYCGAPYTLADGGCRAKCKAMDAHHKLVREAAEADERFGGEQAEVERRFP